VRGRVTPLSLTLLASRFVNISFEDDVTFILLLGVSSMAPLLFESFNEDLRQESSS
jgi:hypothetical protein